MIDPKKRITPEEALESPYFNGVHCKDMEQDRYRDDNPIMSNSDLQ